MAFYDNLDEFGHAIALIAESGETLTYEETARQADSFATHIAQNRLVFILADNCIESVIGYLGCLRGKVPAALLSSNIHASLLAGLLTLYRPNYIWMPRDRAGLTPNAGELFSRGEYVLLAYSPERLVVHEELALLMTTSGSTGSPKFVRQSYTNLEANAASIATYLSVRGNDKAITTLPMHYVYGLSVINSHLHCGAPVVLTGASLLEKRFWALFQSQEATTLSGVPYTYEILRRLRWNRMNLPSLRVLTQAGGKLNAGLVGEFAAICRDKGIRLFVMYGAAEATARMSYLPPESALDKPSSIGVPIPGGEFWIEDEAGNPITDPEEVGELFYRGANVTLGYAMSREDLARGNEREGILATGDMAKCDADGMYYIVGRKSRFVKIFGNRINLEEVEQLLRGINVDCACAGNDEKIRIYMTNASKQEEVLAYVQQLTLLHHSAFQTVVIDSIPRNQAGKIIYSELA